MSPDFSDLSKLVKSELTQLLIMTGYYKSLFTKDERKRIAEAKKTAKAFIDYNQKHGLVGRGFNDFE